MLALDIGSRRIRVVKGRAGRGGAHVVASLAIEIADGIDRADPVAVGTFLRERLAAAGLTDRQAVATIDRRNLILKTASLEGVDEAEIPDVVRLQAMRELTIPIEESTIDYIRMEARRDGEPPLALLAVARQDIIEQQRLLVEAAGLKLVGLWPGPMAQVAAALDRAGNLIPAEATYQLLVVADTETVEVSLLHDGCCLVNVTRPIAGKAEPAASPGKAETMTGIIPKFDGPIPMGPVGPAIQAIRRLRASLPTQWPDAKIGAVLCAGPAPAGTSAEEISMEVGAPVFVFDPLAKVAGDATKSDEHGSFAEVLGAMVVAAKPVKERIDFLRPKKAAVRRDLRRPIALAAIAALLAVAIPSYQWRASQTDRIGKSIAKANDREKKLARELKDLGEFQAQAEFLRGWRNQDVVWLEVLRRFNANMPEPRKVFLTQMSLSSSPRADGPAAILRVEGYADSPKTVTDLMRQLSTTAKFEVRPGTVQPANQVEGFPWRFSADLGVPRDAAMAAGKAGEVAERELAGK